MVTIWRRFQEVIVEILKELNIKTPEEFDGWLLKRIEDPASDLGGAVTAVKELWKQGEAQRAADAADILQETLLSRRDINKSLELLEIRSMISSDDEKIRGVVVSTIGALLKDTMGAAMIASCGLDEKVPVAEALKRLKNLYNLKPGVLCLDKTWGFGVIVRLDDFYKKVTVDFSKKAAHQMSFSYASQSLEILDDGHLLAVKHRKNSELEEMLKGSPAEAVKLAISSYGPISVADINRIFADAGIVPEAEWKNFWERARKALKNDPFVDIPAKRTDPIRILIKEKSYDAEWFKRFRAENDISKIVTGMENLFKERAPEKLSEEEKAVVINRIDFSVNWIANKDHGTLAHLLVMRQMLADSSEQIAKYLADADAVLEALKQVPMREMRNFVKLLSNADPVKYSGILVSILPDMEVSIVTELVPFLKDNGKEKELKELFKLVIDGKRPSVGILIWLAENHKECNAWGVDNAHDVIIAIIDQIESLAVLEQVRLKNLLADLFNQSKWLEEVMAGLSPALREAVVRRINSASKWEISERRTVLGKMIKKYPALVSVISASESKKEGPKILTSWRSYRERQLALKKLIEVDIPNNSKDIAVARSYGDLRENHEYKSAKEHQGLLMKRQAEIEADLTKVTATDFKGFPYDKAGIGTEVTIKKDSGAEEIYCILGEWDSDEGAKIISSKSKLAEVLTGRKAGERVVLPGDQGNKECVIVKVDKLSQKTEDWMKG